MWVSMGRHETSVLSPQNLLYTEPGEGAGAEKTLVQSVVLWETQGRWRDEQDHRGTKPSGLCPGLAFPLKVCLCQRLVPSKESSPFQARTKVVRNRPFGCWWTWVEPCSCTSVLCGLG